MHLLAREEAGLRCLLRVALRGSTGTPVPIAQIAAGEGISGVYAAKLMRQLRRLLPRDDELTGKLAEAAQLMDRDVVDARRQLELG